MNMRAPLFDREAALCLLTDDVPKAVIARRLGTSVDAIRWLASKNGYRHIPAGQRDQGARISIEGDIARFDVGDGLVATVDAADVPLLGGFRWRARRANSTDPLYVQRCSFKKVIKLHRVITSAPSRVPVDHADGDTLNNRRSNLRICDDRANARNRRLTSLNTSGFKGVSRYYRKWIAQIKVDGRTIRLGSFDDKVAAALAYDRAASELFGEFAWLNFPEQLREKNLVCDRDRSKLPGAVDPVSVPASPPNLLHLQQSFSPSSRCREGLAPCGQRLTGNGQW